MQVGYAENRGTVNELEFVTTECKGYWRVVSHVTRWRWDPTRRSKVKISNKRIIDTWHLVFIASCSLETTLQDGKHHRPRCWVLRKARETSLSRRQRSRCSSSQRSE
jgi:hypothetical protein